jgi:hypothetical protein
MSPVKKFSIGGAVGIGIGLIGTGVQWWWPDQRWLGKWLAISGAAVVVIAIVAAIVRALTIKEYERQHPPFPTALPSQQLSQAGIDFKPHIEVNPVFNQTQSREQTQEQSVTEAKAVQGELDCTDCYFVPGILSPSNLLFGDAGIRCMIAQADFYLKPIPGSDPWIELRTQLVFYDQVGSQRLKRVSDGVWRETVNYIQMPLNTGDTRRLVIAIDLGDAGFNSYQYAERQLSRRRFNAEGIFTHILAPEVTPLKVDELTVQVFLSGKYLDRVTLNEEVWFKLSRPDLAIEKIESPRGIETDMKTQF